MDNNTPTGGNIPTGNNPPLGNGMPMENNSPMAGSTGNGIPVRSDLPRGSGMPLGNDAPPLGNQSELPPTGARRAQTTQAASPRPKSRSQSQRTVFWLRFWIYFVTCLVAIPFFGVIIHLIITESQKDVVSSDDTTSEPAPEEKYSADVESHPNKKPLASLTKNEVMDAYAEMLAVDYIPEDMLDSVPPALPAASNPMRLFNLLGSYTDPKDICHSDCDIPTFSDYDLILTPIGDYATFVTIDPDDLDNPNYLYDTGYTEIGVAFNQSRLDYCDYTCQNAKAAEANYDKYDNYYYDDSDYSYDDYSYDDGGSNDDDYYYYDDYDETYDDETVVSDVESPRFVDTSPDFIRHALPLLYLSMDGSAHSLYDFTIEEDEDTISLTAYNIGLGLDLEAFQNSYEPGSGEDVPYALNLYTNRYVVDKDTGIVDAVPDEDGNYNSTFKSYSVTEDEASALSELLYQQMETPQQD